MPARWRARTVAFRSAVKAMSSKTLGKDRSIARRSINLNRYARAMTASMAVNRVADRFYEVRNGSGETYDVDLESGSYTCPDWTYRGDEYVCKHAIRAVFVEVFAHRVSTELVARVVAFAIAKDNPCPHGQGAICDGPAGPRLPCPGCIRATGAGEWAVWNAVVTEGR